jgi:hypothetical protein
LPKTIKGVLVSWFLLVAVELSTATQAAATTDWGTSAATIDGH